MNSLTRVSVICVSPVAMTKLKKAGIAVWSCKKQGARFLFWVKDKDLEKVFAIFSKPCYNVKVEVQSPFKRLAGRLALRAGIIAGAFVFLIAALVADSMVLKIEINGNGSYLEPEIRSIVYEEGVKEFTFSRSFNKPVATGRILSLPQVTFCNIEKRGSVLVISVYADEEKYDRASREPLVADISGKVLNLVAICGRAVAAEGDSVSAGDVLIEAKTLTADGTERDCLAVGYAELETGGRCEYFADCESEENLNAAYASVNLGGNDEIISRSYSVSPADGGVTYIIDYTCLHRISINMS